MSVSPCARPTTPPRPARWVDFLTTGPRQPEAQGLYLAAGYRPLYDRSRPAEEIGPHPFEKTVRP